MTLPPLQRSTDPLLTVLKAAGRAGVSVLLWGDPGTGKSSMLEALAASEGLPTETVIASLREPSDFAGLPVIRETGVEMEPPGWARRLAASEDGYLFLDELSAAPPPVQAALLRVVLDRVVGDLALPSGVRIVAAANPPERAADGWDLPAPQANRFLHVDFAPTTDGWIDGMTAGFVTPTSGRVFEPSAIRRAQARAEVAAFIRTRPGLLHVFPDAETASGRAWPSRRTWTMTADVLALLDPQDTAATLLAATGLVGEGPAIEFITWRTNADLPDPADVIADPNTVTWTDLDPSQAWAILMGVVAHSTAPRTKVAWNAGWKVLAVAAENKLGDIAAASARMMLMGRPAGATPPASVRAFTQVLADAGLVGAPA